MPQAYDYLADTKTFRLTPTRPLVGAAQIEMILRADGADQLPKEMTHRLKALQKYLVEQVLPEVERLSGKSRTAGGKRALERMGY